MKLAVNRGVVPAIVLLSACATPPRDSTPQKSASAPDATPRHEPGRRAGNPSSYVVRGKRYHVHRSNDGHQERGIASWYGRKFHGRRTASGEVYNMYAMTAAHKSLRIPSYARVTNLENGRELVVRVNDRGPFSKKRILDLSFAAAKELGVLRRGTARVEIRALDSRKREPKEPVQAQAALSVPEVENKIYLQVGSFATRRNAERLARNLITSTAQPVEVHTNRVADKTLYRVRIGPLPNESDADRLSREVALAVVDQPRIVRN
jgi:rare lipoprotein A